MLVVFGIGGGGGELGSTQPRYSPLPAASLLSSRLRNAASAAFPSLGTAACCVGLVMVRKARGVGRAGGRNRGRGGRRCRGSDRHSPSPPPAHVSVEQDQSVHQELPHVEEQAPTKGGQQQQQQQPQQQPQQQKLKQSQGQQGGNPPHRRNRNWRRRKQGFPGQSSQSAS
ncbi:uncharacterized protein LOC131874186 [Cryptomeria japonica]|uniref:uncharacterized protein LOC131874186 n=1 Tax=Cryptomeria japonica TaxID=3369 RepID=UPI0027DAA0FA|nr:uncharacterized protein LOC131874186 [Cryptomeria japonica]